MRRETSRRLRLRLEVSGLVQGVGFRPFVHALAHELGLSGVVTNTPDGVVVEVEGALTAAADFHRRIATEAPRLAVVDDVRAVRIAPRGGTEFTIHPSRSGPGRTFVSPDVATCEECLADLQNPANRRYRHPFVSCTNCGPRFTIVTGLPYDRPETTMAGFPMCRECAAEYVDPGDRRFHAQPVCCPACGPRLRLFRPGAEDASGEQALERARLLLADGATLAVKGLGGYHLACDATNEHAVCQLRARKQRGDKPFAVMVADAATAARVARLDPAARAALTSHQRPIVLLPQHRDDDEDDRLRPVEAVAPGNPDLGVQLAYTPVHHLLLGLPGDPPGPGVLVLTSGNVAGEPIVTDDAEARSRLAGLADAWLAHDRPIHRHCDDSVVRVVDGATLPVRRSRGYAPLPVHLPFSADPVLAVGGDLKNTFCLAEGHRAWMSAHVGDMDDFRTQEAFGAAERGLEELTGVRPGAVVADLHPGYRSRRWAVRHSAGRPVTLVQHHHAHVAATLADRGHDGSRRVLGVAFDGTGYGDDGAVWGGEFLLADYASYRRFAHLGYVGLPGGDAGVRNPCRMALSHLRSAGVPWSPDLASLRACAPEEAALLDRQLDTGLHCLPTSSMGRLFDAVASLTGVCHRIGYEAQAAIELEGMARRAPGDREGYRFAGPGPGGAVDCAPVIAAVVSDVRAGVDTAVVAARFHRAVVRLVTEVALLARTQTGVEEVTLSGGVFVNALLSTWCSQDLTAAGFRVLRHRSVPPSDAGISLGQAAVHAHRDPGSDAHLWQAALPPEREHACV